MTHLFLGINSTVLPSLEPAREWVVHCVQHKSGCLTHAFALLNELLPRVKGFRHNAELRFREEQPDDAASHVFSLLLAQIDHKFINLVCRVACLQQLLPQSNSIALKFVSPEDNVAFSLPK